MSSYTTISPEKLARLIGTANAPALIDVRTDKDFADDPRLIPGAFRRNHEQAARWGEDYSGRAAIVYCLRGQKLAQGTAAWLRHFNAAAETLEGGFEGWKAAGLPLIPTSKLPPRDAQGRTVWVTRARPILRGSTSVRKRPDCSRRRSACRACMTMISSSFRPASRSTTPSIAGAATRPARPITGLPTKQRRNGRKCA